MQAFEFYDPEAPITVSRRNLPHWHQPGATCFITFRTADSLPLDVITSFKELRADWLRAHGIDPRIPRWRSALDQLPRGEQVEFYRRFNRTFHDLLDAGHGACVLRKPELAAIVAKAIHHFDGERYHLAAFVVMPNHVHVLMGLIGGHSASSVSSSWKRYTATRINRVLRVNGHFWQSESFDHLVRSGEQFNYLLEYIAKNPEKAGLGEGEYVLHRAEPRREAIESSA